jgi:hypothetical protein
MSKTDAAAIPPRLPTLHESRKAIVAAAVGNVLEWYDFGVGFLMRPHSTHSRRTAAYSTAGISMLTGPMVNPP